MGKIPETLVTTYLEMKDPNQFEPAYIESNEIQLVQMRMPDVEFYLFLYASVGAPWNWRDRLLMDRAELREILSRPTTEVSVIYFAGAPAGYVELDQQGENVELAYFGLRPDYIGRGLGKHLLSYGIDRAWKKPGCRRVWVHTCNLDGPHALANYQKRGLVVYDVVEQPMPERYQ